MNYNLLLNKKFVFSGKREKGGSFYATGQLCMNYQFLVLKGSHSNIANFFSYNSRLNFQKKLSLLQKKINYLMKLGIVIQKNNFYVFQKEYLFNSPSGAALFFVVNNQNGWDLWKEENSHQPLKVFLNHPKN